MVFFFTALTSAGKDAEAKPVSLLSDKAGLRSCQEAGEARYGA